MCNSSKASFSKGIVSLALGLAVCLPLSAQSSLTQILQPPAPASTSSKTPADPLGRDTLSRRDKILFKTVLGLHLDTSADHLRAVLAEIHRVLSSHPKIESSTVRVRLIELAPSAINVELFCYVLTQDFEEFAEVREDLLLRIMNFVEDSGTTLASPSQTLYLSEDAGAAKTRSTLGQESD